MFNQLDENIIVYFLYKQLSGKLVTRLSGVNKHFNRLVKNNMAYFNKLFIRTRKVSYMQNNNWITCKIFLDSHNHGEYKTIDTTGRLRVIESYNYGVPNGPYKTYGDNGEILLSIYYKNGKKEGEGSYQNENGLLYKNFYKKGKKDGEQLEWYDNGQLRYKYFYKDGKQEGEQLYWNKNGQLIYTYFYKEGKLE